MVHLILGRSNQWKGVAITKMGVIHSEDPLPSFLPYHDSFECGDSANHSVIRSISGQGDSIDLFN